MKRSDEIVLDGLEPFALQMVSAEQWALTKQAVADAGGILASDGVVRDLLEKASFASRSEAGRYAANMRWRGEGNSDPANPADDQSSKMATRARSIAEGDLSDIASIIRRDFREQGKKIPASAEPYLDALSTLGSVDDNYYQDSGSSIVAYALSNLGTYKGETARLVKTELKARLKGKKADARAETNDSPVEPTLMDVYFPGDKEERKRFLEEVEGDLEVEIDIHGAHSKMAGAMRSNIARIKRQMREANDSPEFTGRTTGRQGGPAEGPKYKKGMGLKEITANVRRDLKAVKLPEGVKLGVRMRGGMAVVVDIKGYKGDQNSPEAKALKDEIDAVRSAYNRSNSDPMVDYSDETYYGNTDFYD